MTAGKTSRPDHGHHDVGDEHLDDRDHHHRDGADRHRQRRDRPPGRLDVGVGVGEQLAGRVALVPLHREREVLPGHRAAAVRLHAVLHDPGAEPAGDDADRAQQGHAEEQGEHRDQQVGPDLAVLEGRQQHVVGRPAEHPGVGDGQRAEEQAADRGEREDPGLALDRDPEDGEPLGGGGGPLARRQSTRLAHPTTLSLFVPSRPSEDCGATRPPLQAIPGRGHRTNPLPFSNVTLPLPLARRERHALCDTALALGADAPTLCGGWTARDLVAHLLVRENSILGAAGISISPLAGLTERAMARAARRRSPRWSRSSTTPG